MNISFNQSTWEKLLFLANTREMSVAALVAEKMDEFTGQCVNVQYSINKPPKGFEELSMILPSDNF